VKSWDMGTAKTKDASWAKKKTTFVFVKQVGAFLKHSDAIPP